MSLGVILGLVLMELSAMEQRYHAVMEVLAGAPVTEVAERFGVSRQVVHKWRRRCEQEGLPGLAERSRRPKGSPWHGPSSACLAQPVLCQAMCDSGPTVEVRHRGRTDLLAPW